MKNKPNEGGNPLLILNTMCNRNCNRYNGWKNYETWNYALHMSNEGDPLRTYLMQLATMDEYEFSLYLKQECEDEQDSIDMPPVFKDLLNSAISEIDFREIAQSIISDYNDSIEEEQE